MLTKLSVKNYALIKDLVFIPGKSFNVITGETGAGKSILLGAMGLLLGERSDSIAVKENEEKCVIEGFFNIKNYELKYWFDLNEFDYSDELIIRREILTNGKSRAFINDTPAQLVQLKELGKFLIDIHSQHDNLDLFQKSFQFKVLDSFAGNENDYKNYLKTFESLKNTDKKLTELILAEKQGSDERNYKQFLFDELVTTNLKEGELTLLEDELLALSNVDQNLQILSLIINQLSESDTAIVDQVALLKNQLNLVAKNDKRFDDAATRFNELYFILKELNIELNQLTQSTFSDPERLDFVNQRLILLHNLSKKHNNKDLNLVLTSLELELSQYSNLEQEIKSTGIEKSRLENECMVIASKLSQTRKHQSSILEKQINEMIINLGMPGAKIKVEVTSRQDNQLGVYGFDDTNFLFSPAEGKLYNPIQNIASGGEISRVMLVLKAVLAKKNTLPTIIFDEIDSGVSGEVAFKMSDVLMNMAHNMQLIAITHLPQIAAKGDNHFFVFKNVKQGITTSGLRELKEDDRITEIAEMMGGKSFGKAIFESAKQLLLK